MTDRTTQESRTDGDPPWQASTLPQVQPLPASAEVAVVGAGLAGCSLAAGLARGGARVVLLDPLERTESFSRRSAGLLHQGLAEHPARLVASLGEARAADLFALFRRSIERLGRWAAPVDQIWLASLPQERPLLEESVKALARLGLQAALLDAGELSARGLLGEAGFRVSGDALVHPERTWRALLGEALDAGVCLTRTRVRAVHDVAGGVKLATEDGELLTEIVIFACGASARSLDTAFEETLWPVRENAASFRVSLPAISGRAGHGWTWFRPAPEGEGQETVLVGGCRWATPHLEVGETEPSVVEAIQEHIAAFARRYLGAEDPPSAMARWAWIETHSCDGLPLVGPLPGSTRRIACVGFGGHDWALAPACAELVVEGLLGSGPAQGGWLSPARML